MFCFLLISALILMTSLATRTGCLSMKDEHFFKDLGTRIALARKGQNLTQTDLALSLGVAQQTLAHYEGGRLRLPASMLPVLAQVLGLTTEELLGQNVDKASSKRGPTPRLQQQIDRISQLPKPKQRFVMEMLDTVLAQASQASGAAQAAR